MAFKINNNSKKEPIGGHHFKQKTKNGEILVIRADKLSDLYDKIKSYRLSNGMPLGDPEEEVAFFYYENWPYLVTVDDSKRKKKIDRAYELWRASIQNVWRKAPTKFITPTEAGGRHLVCLKCPYNVEKNWPMGDEAQASERRAFMLRRGEQVPKQLGFCALHLCDIGVMSFIETPSIVSSKPKDEENYRGCWV